jgi:hypothetical protein
VCSGAPVAELRVSVAGACNEGYWVITLGVNPVALLFAVHIRACGERLSLSGLARRMEG